MSEVFCCAISCAALRRTSPPSRAGFAKADRSCTSRVLAQSLGCGTVLHRGDRYCARLRYRLPPWRSALHARGSAPHGRGGRHRTLQECSPRPWRSALHATAVPTPTVSVGTAHGCSTAPQRFGRHCTPAVAPPMVVAAGTAFCSGNPHDRGRRHCKRLQCHPPRWRSALRPAPAWTPSYGGWAVTAGGMVAAGVIVGTALQQPFIQACRITIRDRRLVRSRVARAGAAQRPQHRKASFGAASTPPQRARAASPPAAAVALPGHRRYCL